MEKTVGSRIFFYNIGKQTSMKHHQSTAAHNNCGGNGARCSYRGWVMTLRTPRRRISPRTIRRYRAIKNFVRRALGTSSQPDIKTNSSVCVSVLDLREKIHGIEQQLNTVSRHCQDLASLESRLKLKDIAESEKDINTDTKPKIVDTTIPSKTSADRHETRVIHANNSESTPNVMIINDEGTRNITAHKKMLDQNIARISGENHYGKLYNRLDPIQESEQIWHSRRNRKASRTLPNSFHEHYSQSITEPKNYKRHLDASYSEVHRQKSRKNVEPLEIYGTFNKSKKEQRCGDYKNKNHRNKYLSPDLDHDYITDIIRRQYRPVKLFGRRESEFSQFSAPVCRDQEFPIRDTVQEGIDLCSCCGENHRHRRHTKHMCNNDLSDVRSICDTRLYSSKKHKHHTHCRERAYDFYNDSTMYDIIPVKERASPKSRRKFVEDNEVMQDTYREVPPSPRTHRPQLNLQTQYRADDDDDEIITEKQLRRMKRLQRKTLIQNKGNVSQMSSEVFIHNKHFKGIQNSQIPCNTKPYHDVNIGTASSLQYQSLPLDQTLINNDTTLNTQTDVSGDKTDKTLNEIKDILQSFLDEIKKETLQNEKTNSSAATNEIPKIPETQNHNNNSNFNNNIPFGHCSMPLMQSFPNCCYPIVPVCPMNVQIPNMQNGYVVPSPSFTCSPCVSNSKERACGCSDFKNKTNSTEDASSETKKLLKEIHNLISQHPNPIPKNESCKKYSQGGHNNNNTETKILTSRSVGGSSGASKRDAKVGSSKIKSHSKSCEAIGSREATDTRYATNISYSDTVLEKGSGEETITETSSESQYSSELTVMDKVKENKFKKMLRSIGILKKNKRDIIEESSESENNVEVHRPPQKSVFPQQIINYNMHGQEYFNPPPTTPYNQQQYEYYGPMPRCDPKTCYSPTYCGHTVQKHGGRSPCTSPNHMAVPPCGSYYDPRYLNVSPQVPVCLKEIEVKSIGTQSIRKMSLLQKITNKMQVPVQQAKTPSPKQSSIRNTLKEKNTNNLFDWKKIHEKAMQKTTDPLKFSYKTQKRLAEGDNTMRNAMLKKLFYKRNPFSPRNLLVRTLLGKDRSSFGEPPKMYKPKMFL